MLSSEVFTARSLLPVGNQAELQFQTGKKLIDYPSCQGGAGAWAGLVAETDRSQKIDMMT